MDMVKKPSSLASGYGNSFAPIDDWQDSLQRSGVHKKISWGGFG